MGTAYAEKIKAGEKDLGSPHIHIAVAFLGALAQLELPSPSKEILECFATLVNKMSRLHVGDLIPYFRIKAAYAQKDQPKSFKIQIMYNALAVSPFLDDTIITAVNKAREQRQDDGPKEPIKPPQINVQQFRQAVHQALPHVGGKTVQGSAPPSTLERALQNQLRARQM